MSDPRRDMQLLFDVEYGVRRELVIRLVSVVAGAVLIHAYEGWWSPFVWCTGYLLTHAVHYRYVVTHMERTRERDLKVAGGLYLVVVLAFLWLPAYLATYDDPIKIYVGAVLMTSTMVYQIRRADRILWLNWAQILIFSVLVLIVLISHLPHFDGLLPKSGAVFVTLAAFAYIALAMLYARKSRLDMEEAAERLAQEQKMSAIGRLAGGVAHDFNNILTVVQGNLELYHLMEEQQERDAAVEEAQVAVKRAEAVVQHLLVYARKAPTRKALVDANASVASAMTLVRSMVPSNVHKEFQACSGRLLVELDESQLVTALLNLVKNSVDAMETGGHLTVRTEMRVLDVAIPAANGVMCPPGAYVAVVVEDTGAGIAHEDLSKVAEPFFTTKRPGQGTGLGLSMVTGFVQSAGGALLIERLESGTRVTMLFPALAQRKPEDQTENAAPRDGVLIT